MKEPWTLRPAALPFFYGWVILAVTTLGVLASIPGQTMGVSVFTDPLLEATGLSRLAFSQAYLVGTVASGLALSAGGAWLDRFGARRTVAAACAGLGVTLVYLSLADRIAAALAERLAGLGAQPTAVAWVVLAVGFAALRFCGQGMLTLVSRTTLARWFERRRGRVAAISGAFVNFGFAAAPLGLHRWIELAGWRGAWQGMALVVGVGMGLLGAFFYRHDPESCGLRPDGDPPVPPAPRSPRAGHPAPTRRDAARAPVGRGARPEFDRAQALRTGAFWLVTLGIASHAMVGTGLTFHIVDLGAEAGLAAEQAVAIFLPIALISTSMGFLAGAALDRLPVRILMLAMMLFEMLMYAGMAHFEAPAARWAGIAGWGLASGFYGPLTLAALPHFFGRLHLGAIQGVQMTLLVVASAFGPAVLAAFQGVFGSYRNGLLLLCSLPAAVALAAPFTRTPRPPAPRER